MNSVCHVPEYYDIILKKNWDIKSSHLPSMTYHWKHFQKRDSWTSTPWHHQAQYNKPTLILLSFLTTAMTTPSIALLPHISTIKLCPQHIVQALGLGPPRLSTSLFVCCGIYMLIPKNVKSPDHVIRWLDLISQFSSEHQIARCV